MSRLINICLLEIFCPIILSTFVEPINPSFSFLFSSREIKYDPNKKAKATQNPNVCIGNGM